jgi:protein-disulfide isomerase
MALRIRGISPLAFMVGVVLLLGSQSWVLAMKGPKISLGDAPSMKEGSPESVLVEVSDFQCPYCGQSAREVLPQVYEKFVRTGKVEILYLHLPLQMHPHAFKAAEAAACAGDQKKFWDMHHVLFANQQALAPVELPGYAEGLGLDVAAFQKCLSSGRHGGDIRRDMRIAQSLGLTSTPAYLLGRRSPGSDKIQIVEIVRGLHPYEELEKKLNDLVAPK